MAPTVTTARARAQPNSARHDASIAAEALFSAGRADIERSDYAAACPKFAESQRLDPAVGTLINLADCEEHLQHLARAWQLWREAAERLSADDPRTPTVMDRAASIDQRVPRLIVRLAPSVQTAVRRNEDRGAPDAARWTFAVRRDDVVLAPNLFEVPVPLDPGAHVVTLQATGHFTTRYPITLKEGGTSTVVVELGAAEAPRIASPPPTTAPAPPPRASTTWMGIGLLGVGALGLGLGSVTGLVAIDKKQQQDEHCFPAGICGQAGSDAASSGRTFATVSTVSFLVGGAAALAGLYFVLHGRSSDVRARAAVGGDGPGGRRSW